MTGSVGVHKSTLPTLEGSRPAALQARSKSGSCRRTASSVVSGVPGPRPVGPTVTQLLPWVATRARPLAPPAAMVSGSGRCSAPGVLGASAAV